MARAARDAKLENRTGRLKLEIGKRYFLPLADGLSLMYRRTAKGYGTWSIRAVNALGREKYLKLGSADDYQDADGVDTLTFSQAQAKGRVRAKEIKELAHTSQKLLTVEEAARHYLSWFKEHRKSVKETENTVRAHILPTLGDHLVADLTTPIIRKWQESIATAPPRKRTSIGSPQAFKPRPTSAGAKRARYATANRILTVLKAILNKAFEDGLVAEDAAWRRVKPFKGADEPIVRFLTESESNRLVNACEPDLRQLVKAALFTGGRYGELARLEAKDVNLDTAQVYLYGKSNKGRYVPLSPAGFNLFQQILVGKKGTDRVFTHNDGRSWGKNHHIRNLKRANKHARIDPPVRFHELRHTYASTLAQMGVDLLTISKLLGHADTRITSRHYAHLCDNTLKAAVAKLPNFGHQPETKVRAIR